MKKKEEEEVFLHMGSANTQQIRIPSVTTHNAL